MSVAPTRTAIGLDLGGTKTEAIVIDIADSDSFAVRLRRRIPTPSSLGYEAILDSTASLIAEIEKEADLPIGKTTVGVGMPGGLTRAGLVKNSNTVCLNGRPFRQDLVRHAGRAISFENDANCFALAEATLGAAKAHREGIVFGVIMGTGVGGGIVMGGKVWDGRNGIAGEWGHHAVFHGRGPICYCGKQGCLETFASGPAVENDYATRSGNKRLLSEIANRREVDAAATASIEGLLDAFGRGLANVIDILDPSAIVLGGGLSNLDLLYEEGRMRVARYVFNDELTTPILRNELGDSAGVIGAALVAIETS